MNASVAIQVLPSVQDEEEVRRPLILHEQWALDRLFKQYFIKKVKKL